VIGGKHPYLNSAISGGSLPGANFANLKMNENIETEEVDDNEII